MTEEYFRARRQLILWSGVLFAYHAIGLDFSALSEYSDATGALYRTLLRPELIPVVFVVVVGYLLTRFLLEFARCSEQERRRRPSWLDFLFSVGICVASLAYFGFNAVGESVFHWIQWRVEKHMLVLLPIAYLLLCHLLRGLTSFLTLSRAEESYVMRTSDQLLSTEDATRIRTSYAEASDGVFDDAPWVIGVGTGAVFVGSIAARAIGNIVLKQSGVPSASSFTYYAVTTLSLVGVVGAVVQGVKRGRRAFSQIADAVKREKVLDMWARNQVGTCQLPVANDTADEIT